MRSIPSKAAGVTLLELLVTLSILAITVSLSAPMIGETLSRNQLSTTTNTLQRSISLTRAEAIKRGHRAVMCLSNLKTKCDGNSAKYLLIFSDSDRSGDPTSASDLIKIQSLDHRAIKVSYNRPFLAFSSIGYASGTNGTFKICHQNGAGEMLVVSTLGRTRQAVDYNGDGLVEKTPGHPISC